MASLIELTAKVAELRAQTAAALARVQVDVDKLKADIAAGGKDVIKESDLDSISTELGSIITTLKAVDPLPDFPAPVTPV